MESEDLIVRIDQLGGLAFNLTNALVTIIACSIVFFVVFFCTRHLTLKPGKKQNFIEWLIDFVRNIITGAMPWKEGRDFHLLAFGLIAFIFVSNIMGLALKLSFGGHSYWKSPTADPIVTLTLAMLMIVLTHYFSVKKFGFKNYVKNNYLKPVGFLLPIKLLEEFTNMLTLGLRLYGNIFAGEVLLGLISGFGKSHGILTGVAAIPLEMIWQGFSIFIGSIQAFVFVTLSMVYMAHKVEVEE